MINNFTIEEHRSITEKLIEKDKVIENLLKIDNKKYKIFAIRTYLKQGLDHKYINKFPEIYDVCDAILHVYWGPANDSTYHKMDEIFDHVHDKILNL